ncbi:hypothetical protein Dip518_000344 [Parelusimicrobium proximum]|uniref:hypothetical protein n=1 Tax=Parelusimicrobium proximum TaxID=3228953 RepID=UPI003D178B62
MHKLLLSAAVFIFSINTFAQNIQNLNSDTIRQNTIPLEFIEVSEEQFADSEARECYIALANVKNSFDNLLNYFPHAYLECKKEVVDDNICIKAYGRDLHYILPLHDECINKSHPALFSFNKIIISKQPTVLPDSVFADKWVKEAYDLVPPLRAAVVNYYKHDPNFVFTEFIPLYMSIVGRSALAVTLKIEAKGFFKMNKVVFWKRMYDKKNLPSYWNVSKTSEYYNNKTFNLPKIESRSTRPYVGRGSSLF